MLGRTQVSRAALLCFFASLLLSVSPALFGQGARMNPSGAGEEADRDNPAAREAWFARGRTAPKGKSAADLRWKAYQQKIQMRAAAMAAARRAGTNAANAGPLSAGWTALGPAPLVSKADPSSTQDYGLVSGRSTAVAIDHADISGNTVYIGGAYGGVWRTTNGLSGGFGNPNGVTWTPLIDNQPTLAVGSIAIQPNNATGTLSNVILVGTGEPNGAIDSYYGLGILRSIDAGKNWNMVPPPNGGLHPFKGLGISKIAFNTTSGQTNVVVAAAASTIGSRDGARQLGQISGPFFSTDAGATWSAATTISDGSFGGAVAPISTTSVVYNAVAGKFYMAMRFHGFYSSTDGANWTRLAAQPAPAGASLNSAATCPTTLVNPITCPILRAEMAVVPTRNEMYVWYTFLDSSNHDLDEGIWKSTNGGTSWTPVTDTGIASCGNDDQGCGIAQAFYDLELAAVPVGASNTDLYAGTRNLYKCTISTAFPTCNGTSEPYFFMNLTHVYGCDEIANVHPDQHHLDFLPVAANNTVPMYFANDGGIYRAVDEITGLTTGICSGTKTSKFDDLNKNLGSMTQFVSFSQDATNAAVILGGTQDNGSPATNAAGTNSQWQSVNFGDGGYNEISPTNANDWFTANTDVSIQSCTLGSACTGNIFNTIVSRGTVGGDVGSFYTPYILDPQNSSGLLVGTCRIWQGSTTGASFSAISPNFDSGIASVCTGNEFNFVRAIAAGGPTDANGFSKVVYAVTEGTGPLANTKGGGAVEIGTETTSGQYTWLGLSYINPNFYTIGSVAVDNHDATGGTAYVGLMGFSGTAGTGHVFQKTPSIGVWADFSTGLPDAPVNSLIVDSSVTPSVLYAGTDVGVFSTSTSAANWTEVGPKPMPGATGYIPNAPVTKLRLFSSGGNKKLRASTYGRGIWEFVLAVGTPSYTITVANPTVTAYPGLPGGTFNGTLTSVNNYAGTVTLSCSTGKPTTCTPPAPITLTAGGTTNFSVTAANPTAPATAFNFNIHGTDNTILVDAPVTLNVVDFTIGALDHNAVTANVPNPSTPVVTFTVSAAGPFADPVTLTCPGVPAGAGAACNFSPASVQPTLGNPVTVTLTIATATCTPSCVGVYPVTITAHDATNPEPSPKTQPLTLTVTALPDFTMAISGSPKTITVLQPSATFTGTLTAVNGFNSAVAMSCLGGKPSNCTISPNPVTFTAGVGTFTVTADNGQVPGVFKFNVSGTGGGKTNAQPVMLTVNADIDIIATNTTATVTAGGSANYMLTFSPHGQSTFQFAVAYTVSGLPGLTTPVFNPSSIAQAASSTPVTLTISTTATIASLNPPAAPWKPSGPLFAFWLSLPAVGIVAMGAGRNPKRRWLAMLAGGLLLLMLVGSLAGCGGSSHHSIPGTPPGTYPLTITATSGTGSNMIMQTKALTLIVQ